MPQSISPDILARLLKERGPGFAKVMNDEGGIATRSAASLQSPVRTAQEKQNRLSRILVLE